MPTRVGSPTPTTPSKGVQALAETTFLDLWLKPLQGLMEIKNLLGDLCRQAEKEDPSTRLAEALKDSVKVLETCLWAAQNTQDSNYPINWEITTLPRLSNLFFAATEIIQAHEQQDYDLPNCYKNVQVLKEAQARLYQLIQEHIVLKTCVADLSQGLISERRAEFEERFRTCFFNLKHENQLYMTAIDTALNVYLIHHPRLVVLKERAELNPQGIELLLLDGILHDKSLQHLMKLEPQTLHHTQKSRLDTLREALYQEINREFDAVLAANNPKLSLRLQPGHRPHQASLSDLSSLLHILETRLKEPTNAQSTGRSPFARTRKANHSLGHAQLHAWLSQINHQTPTRTASPNPHVPIVSRLIIHQAASLDKSLDASPIQVRRLPPPLPQTGSSFGSPKLLASYLQDHRHKAHKAVAHNQHPLELRALENLHHELLSKVKARQHRLAVGHSLS